MEFEKLALEVSAVKSGLTPVDTRSLIGDSGVEHAFTFLFSDGGRMYGFDFYDSVTDVEVIKSYAKKFDSHASVNIVCMGNATEDASALALRYGMRILGPEALQTFFALEPPSPRSKLR